MNYIDLADGRDFVNGINKLDKAAKEARVFVTSGASSVPAISAAAIDTLLLKSQLQPKKISIGISPGTQTDRYNKTSI